MVKKIRLTKQNIANAIKNVLNEEYRLTCLDELMEYMWLKPFETHLNVDLFVDDGGSYKRNGHKLLLFARNGYDKSVNDFIPFSIEPMPFVLDTEMDFNISYDDVFDIMDFIQANVSRLIQLANQTITQNDFVNGIEFPKKMIAEKKIINEMATLRKADSNLPMDIWLDEGATYTGHAPRLKFRASNEQRTTMEFSSMILSNPPTIENLPVNSPLRKKDIEKLKKFVIDNLDILLKLANNEIDYRSDFLPNIKK